MTYDIETYHSTSFVTSMNKRNSDEVIKYHSGLPIQHACRITPSIHESTISTLDALLFQFIPNKSLNIYNKCSSFHGRRLREGSSNSLAASRNS